MCCLTSKAAEIVDVEFGGAPLPLQGAADKVIEKQRNQQPERAEIRRYENEGDQTPDLAVQKGVEIKGQKLDGAGVVSCADFPIRLILHENRLRVIKKL